MSRYTTPKVAPVNPVEKPIANPPASPAVPSVEAGKSLESTFDALLEQQVSEAALHVVDKAVEEKVMPAVEERAVKATLAQAEESSQAQVVQQVEKRRARQVRGQNAVAPNNKDNTKSTKVNAIEDQARLRVGKVISTAGLQVLVLLDLDGSNDKQALPRIGSNVCIETKDTVVVGMVSAMSAPTPDVQSDVDETLIAELELVGQIVADANGKKLFRRGISTYPLLGDVTAIPSQIDYQIIYANKDVHKTRIGKVTGYNNIPANVSADELVKGNFTLLGKSGAGKSCAVVRILRALVQQQHHSRIIIFDQHNEYSGSFGKAASVVKLTPSILPHWLLSFDEICHLLSIHSGPISLEEAEILEEAIPAAKKRYMQKASGTRAGLSAASIDAPMPYTTTDLLNHIGQMSALSKSHEQSPARRLQSRIGATASDARYSFIFGKIAAQDSLAQLIQTLFQFNGENKPISILNCSNIQPEISEVVFSAISRISASVAKLGGGKVPILLVVEDAHRFAPADRSKAVLASRAMRQVIERGPKVGVNACLISSRPRAIYADILEQCSTIFSMRMSNRSDQNEIIQIAPEVPSGLLATIGTLDKGEAVAIGEGLPLPMRLKFDPIPKDAQPSENGINKQSLPQTPLYDKSLDEDFVKSIVEMWRFEDQGSLSFAQDEEERTVALPPKI